jgi:ribosome-binding protein aMBF1 (putative translation factor)
MLVHTRRHHTKVVPATKALPEKEENISWRDSAKKLIEKYSEAGAILRGARFKNDFTQKQLAEKLGVKPHHISEMEHGKRSIGKTMARRLAEVLDVDYRVFL